MKNKFPLFILITLLIITGCNKNIEDDNIIENEKPKEEIKEVSIIDMNSNKRPYAVVINNFPSATKVQSGLQEAYMIYEFPIEGGMSRSLAMYKDKKDVKIGTIRSARHDYIDYVLENDAIFVHFGMNSPANKDIISKKIDYIDGNTNANSAFWRENPKKLATEHTVYTNLSKIIKYSTKTKRYRDTTDVKPSLKYTTEEVNLNNYEDSKKTNKLEITYSNSYKVSFKYNTDTNRYDRLINGTKHKDYFTKEQYDCKNILVILLNWGYTKEYTDAAGNNYLDLHNTGTGKGYYITNGYAKEIIWNKKNRSSQTTYTYLDGKEVEINDGNTWIMFNSKSQGVKIS